MFDFLINLLGGGLVGTLTKALGQAHKDRLNAKNDHERIEKDKYIASLNADLAAEQERLKTERALAVEGTKRQLAKMNSPVFWGLIIATLGPAILTMWTMYFYNLFFWENGIWPQPWSVAEFPPQAAVWVNMSINWLFDPVGLSASVGVAGTAAWVMRK